MSTITIRSIQDVHVQGGCCSAPPHINLAQAVRDRSAGGTVRMTRDVAINILESVKWDSQVKSFFTCPLFLLPTIAVVIVVVVVAGALLLPVNVALLATISMASSLALCLCITASNVSFLGPLSDSYATQAREAEVAIKQLKGANSNTTVMFT